MVEMISTGMVPCAGSGNGQVKLSVSYSSQEGQLSVLVHGCRCASLNTLLRHSQTDCPLSRVAHLV